MGTGDKDAEGAMTCQQGSDVFVTIDAGPACDAPKSLAQLVCCPSQAAPTCAFCPAGASSPTAGATGSTVCSGARPLSGPATSAFRL
jgi:hypothetical protein